ncbi:hypothetical protein Daus18300_008684 [Diaporthe australafricana]|uniref:2EXR domain-containing protein n=1 Tax=Diaporthe australafricana TaxID=127596 RepID=A0ABR3WH52_9PEZI
MADMGFPRFKTFPCELRRMIWKEALPPEHPQVLIWNYERSADQLFVPILPPAILHACQESRNVALEHVRIAKLDKNEFRNLPHKDACHHVVFRPFAPETDHIYINFVRNKSFIDSFLNKHPLLAQNLIIDEISIRLDIFSWDHFMNAAANNPNLKSIGVYNGRSYSKCKTDIICIGETDLGCCRAFKTQGDGSIDGLLQRLESDFLRLKTTNLALWKKTGDGDGEESGNLSQLKLCFWSVEFEQIRPSTWDKLTPEAAGFGIL